MAFVSSTVLVGEPNWSPTTRTSSWVSDRRSMVLAKFFPSPYSHAVRRINQRSANAFTNSSPASFVEP